MRLAERCATLLYSVKCEINEAGPDTAVALAEPVEQLCGALDQVRRGSSGFARLTQSCLSDPDVSRDTAPPAIFEAVCKEGRNCAGARSV